MSVIVDKDTMVIVQGITGNEGRFHTISMKNYGTSIVAGCTPGKGGEIVDGIPVYNTVAEGVEKHGANTSIVFVPARAAKASVRESIEAGIKTIVVITEGIPQIDEIEFIARARQKGVIVIGPNCPGIINPVHKIKVGILPVHIFQPGKIGIISRSGTLTYEIAWNITQAGAGQSTCIGMGGDPIIGLDFVTLLDMFRNDEETEGVVLIGEIGGSAEENAARYIVETKYPKPVVAYIAGRTAPQGKRMGHAGAIIMGSAGTAQSKIEAYAAAGVPVAEKPSDIMKLFKQLLVIGD
ncbi:MAG: succinate--CoA ligase subunit alpha [Dehalococcoidales bacterium]|nr:succinate--CoA ligase subunit alpha [Dehalococcoidales bacterium]